MPMTGKRDDSSGDYYILREHIARYEQQGYAFKDACALAGVRLVNETHEQWRVRTSRIILNNALNGLAESMEQQKRKIP